MGKRRKAKTNKKIKLTIPQLIIFGIFTVAFVVFAFSEQARDISSKITDAVAGIDVKASTYPCEVRFIDVGQGDASLVISDGEAILIDAGENTKGDEVVDYLERMKIKELSMIVATHPHSDHIGGIDVVMESFPVKKVLMPELKDEVIPTTGTFTDFLDAMEKQKIIPTYAKPGDEFIFGKGVFTVFAPVQEFDDLNNSSIGLKFVYDNAASFLFTGDMEKKAEKAVLEQYSPEMLKADVLKSGHHGSKTSSSKDFFWAVNPAVCVISVGTGNSYGLPNDEIIKRYTANGAQIYRTDFHGDIAIGFDGEYHLSYANDTK